jgi:hypothetical protein
MKIFNEQDLNVMKQLALVNNGFIIASDGIKVTDAITRNIAAFYEWNKPEPFRLGLHRVSDFLTMIAIMGGADVDIEQDGGVLILRHNRRTMRYFLADLESDEMKAATMKGRVNFAASPSKFTLPADVISEIRKAASVLDADEIEFRTEGSGVVAEVGRGQQGNTYSVALDASEILGEFSTFIKFKNFRIMDDDYAVQVAVQGKAALAVFEAKSIPALSYAIAGQAQRSVL